MTPLLVGRPRGGVSPAASPQVSCPPSRRDVLRHAGGGFGALAFASLLSHDLSRARAAESGGVTETRQIPHHPARAKSVIWCFMDGGPSHLDLFDPKPALAKLAGKPLPPSFPRPMTAMGVTAGSPLLASTRKFRRHGASGLWVSDLYPELAACVDEITVLRSCKGEGQTHVSGVTQLNTGSLLQGRPSLGAWSLYGLGSECQNLPGFVVLADYPAEPPGGPHNWGSGFLPATYQGTKFSDGPIPVLDVAAPPGVSNARQRAKLDFIHQLNDRYAARHREADYVTAQIKAYELAYRMQRSTPEVVDLSRETAETQRLYGLDVPATAKNGRNALLARRLVERGVRFVQLYMGAGTKWDAHTNLNANHEQYCRESDRPIAGLLKDLKRRGMLNDTLVVWGGEFGRTPMSESGNGRDHNPFGFTMWMAGGGVRKGFQFGATDDVGLYAVDNPVHVHDIHATILHLLGLNHKELTFFVNGRDERPTVNGGSVITEIIG